MPSREKMRYHATGPVTNERRNQIQNRRRLTSEAQSPTPIAITIQAIAADAAARSSIAR